MRSAGIRKALYGAIAIFASCAFGLLLCEAALRLQEPYLHIMKDKYRINLLYAPHPLWDHWPRPGFQLSAYLLPRKRYPDPVVFRFNSYGCRDGREPQVPKPQGLKRILVLGDSFTEGIYEEDTLAATLQRRLDQVNERYEVINCGCVSYSPLLHFLRLKHQLLKLSPDVIVMNVDLTDVYDDYSRYRPLYDFSQTGEPVAMRALPRWINRSTAWAVSRFDLEQILYSYRAGIFRAAYVPLSRLGIERSVLGIAPTETDLFSYHSTLSPDSDEWKRGVDFCLGNVLQILRLVREHGGRLMVTTYPHKEQLHPDKSGRLWNRAVEFSLERLCQDQVVEYYSAFDGIRSAVDAGQPVFFDNDMHFRPEGQRIWGSLVATFVRSRLGGDAHAAVRNAHKP